MRMAPCQFWVAAGVTGSEGSTLGITLWAVNQDGFQLEVENGSVLKKAELRGQCGAFVHFCCLEGPGLLRPPPALCTGEAAARCPSRGPILVPSVGGMQPRAAFSDFSCSYRLPVSVTPSRTGSWSHPAGVCEQRWGQPGANLPGEAKPWSCWPRPMACQGALLPARSRRVLPGGEYPWQGTDAGSQKPPSLLRSEGRGSVSVLL